MKKPTWQLKFALETIAKLETEANKLKSTNLKLTTALENIMSACDGNNDEHRVFYFTAKDAIDNNK